MRTSGKGNNARKVLSYFSVNFNITPPYKVLCDGPTIFQALKNDLYLKQALPTLLGATAYPVITECVVKELRNLGEEYSNAALFAKRATRVPCTHEGSVSANECVIARINEPYESKLLLATNDADTLTRVSKIPGVPLITIVNQTRLALKAPSRSTIQYVHLREGAKAGSMNKQDQDLLDKIRAEEAASRPERKALRKRKKAKGPNPLSVKKSTRVSKKRKRSEQERKPDGGGTQETTHISAQQLACEAEPAQDLEQDPLAEQAQDISSWKGPREALVTGHSSTRKRKRRKRGDMKPGDLQNGGDGLKTGRSLSPDSCTDTKRHPTGDVSIGKEATPSQGLTSRVQVATEMQAGPLPSSTLYLGTGCPSPQQSSSLRRDGPTRVASQLERVQQDQAAQEVAISAMAKPSEIIMQVDMAEKESESAFEHSNSHDMELTGEGMKKKLTIATGHEEVPQNASLTDSVSTGQTNTPGTLPGKKKKQRKNRRRRPKKVATTT